MKFKISQYAKRYGVSTRTVWNWMYNGKVKFEREPDGKHIRSADGTLINADVNGSYNILRKCMPNAFDADGVAGVLVHPVVIKATNAFH